MIGPILNAQGERLDLAYTPAAEDRATVVIGHGVTANKDRDWALALHDALRDHGYGALRFSFSGNGESEGDFRESTITKEVADLGSVLDALQRAEVHDLVYAGHSMGGAVGVLRAAVDPRIRALVSLAGMVHTAEFARRKFSGLQPGRDVMWDKPECPLSTEFLEDMAHVRSLLPKIDDVRCPWLLVHGDEDTVVPHDESAQIAAARPDVRLVTLSGRDHLFGGGEVEMADHVVAWLESLRGRFS